jgi:hypothetical protein
MTRMAMRPLTNTGKLGRSLTVGLNESCKVLIGTTAYGVGVVKIAGAFHKRAVDVPSAKGGRESAYR